MPKPRLTIDGRVFRDLNGNGKLDIYEDPRQPVEARVEDLLQQLTLAEKAGLMFHGFAFMTPEGEMVEGHSPFGEPYSTQRDFFGKHISHAGLFGMAEPAKMIAWHNAMQLAAEETRLGIPLAFSTDPCHGAGHRDLNNNANPAFSSWPQPIGLGAIDDEAVTEQFGDIARQEYRAVGIHMALHPTADLATEPRWARIVSTFGEDAQVAKRQIAAYLRGFQGPEVGPESVVCMTKHFPGGGPQLNGDDAHFDYGREQVYPGGQFDYHLIPFEGAFAAGTAQVMPYYGMPIGTEYEEVGFGFNKSIITGLLREKYGFDGVVCTDWGLITDAHLPDGVWAARAWGVEHLSMRDRVKKVLDAGCDMFGGETCVELVIDLVEAGEISMARIDTSIRRILRDKFKQGMFDDPYVDAARALQVVGNAEFRAAGLAAQRRAVVPLHNDRGLLPVQGRQKVYVEGMDAGVVADYADVVADPAQADVAIVRLSTPFYPRENGIFLEKMFHTGDLTFTAEALAPILARCAQVPTIVDIYLDRPAVIPEIRAASGALTGSFGVSDQALCDVLFGRCPPTGRLPFELPSSMTAVRAQHPDAPHDSVDPLFAYGHAVHWTI